MGDAPKEIARNAKTKIVAVLKRIILLRLLGGVSPSASASPFASTARSTRSGAWTGQSIRVVTRAQFTNP